MNRLSFPVHHNRSSISHNDTKIRLKTIIKFPSDLIDLADNKYMDYDTFKAFKQNASEDDKKKQDLINSLHMIANWMDPTDFNKRQIYYQLNAKTVNMTTIIIIDPFIVRWNNYLNRYEYKTIDLPISWSKIMINPNSKCLVNFVIRNLSRKFIVRSQILASMSVLHNALKHSSFNNQTHKSYCCILISMLAHVIYYNLGHDIFKQFNSYVKIYKKWLIRSKSEEANNIEKEILVPYIITPKIQAINTSWRKQDVTKVNWVRNSLKLNFDESIYLQSLIDDYDVNDVLL